MTRDAEGTSRTRVDRTAARTAFRAFYREHYFAVLGLSIALCGDRTAGEDIAQEAFTRAYRDWQSIGSYDAPGAWVRRVATNLAMSRWRRLRSETRAVLRLGRGAQDSYRLPETDETVWKAVRGLPPMQARAMALYYVEDLSVAQIAEVLGCAEGTAKVHLHRGRKGVARRLGLEEARNE